MSKTLDIDKNIDIWMPAFKNAMNGGDLSCPRCNSDKLEVTKRANSDGVGFMLITCNSCGKSGYFSRVIFKDKHTA